MLSHLNLQAADGSRHFAALPESASWETFRNYLSQLPGAHVTDFLTDGVTEVWIDFTYSDHVFTVNNQFGEYWFFVEDHACPDLILSAVVKHCASLLGAPVP